MFKNPFKKNDDLSSYKLDEEPLTPLSQSDSANALESPFPASPSSSEDFGTSEFDNAKTSQDFSSSLGNNTSQSMSNPFAPPSQSSFDNNQNAPMQPDNTSSLQNDVTKAKIDTIESKIALVEAKLGNIENKIDIIYQLISAEVSQETRAKLNVNNALDRLKRNN